MKELKETTLFSYFVKITRTETETNNINLFYFKYYILNLTLWNDCSLLEMNNIFNVILILIIETTCQGLI